MASVKGYFLPPIRRKLYAHGILPTVVGWKSLAQAALFQLDFSGCWSRISSCTGRADFSAAGSASPFCPVLVPATGWHRDSCQRRARPTPLPCQAPAPCVPPFCEIGAFRAAPENLGPWCVGTSRDGPAGYSEVSSCPGFRPQRRVMLLLALPPPPTSVQPEQ